MSYKQQNAWATIEEAIQILKACRFYTQCYIIPEEEWMKVQSILMSLEKEDLPESVRGVVDSLLEMCPHGSPSRKDCKPCWDKAMEWV